MTIRTISQLPEETTGPQNDAFIEISQPYNDAYISKKLKYNTLKTSLNNYLTASVGDTYSMYKLDGNKKKPLNLSSMYEDINALSAGSTNLYGVKTFKSIPKVSISDQTIKYKQDDGTGIPNIMEVKRLIDSRACFIDNTYTVNANPGTEATPAFAVDSNKFLHWHFNDNGTDSSEWMNPERNNQKTEQLGARCYQQGWLTIYGWLADNGVVLPQDAWVGLYGQVNIYDEDQEQTLTDRWVLLQVQPWIKGTNSSRLQYVSFGLPVNEGLRLKIKTGFQVNGHVGGFQDSRSLTFALNQPNSFIGYILHPENN